MNYVLPVMGVSFAAFCVWLAVRIVNRRERWAKWTAFGIAAAIVYLIGFGPACWVASRTANYGRPGYSLVFHLYRPVAAVARHGPAPVADWLGWWSRCGAQGNPIMWFEDFEQALDAM